MESKDEKPELIERQVQFTELSLRLKQRIEQAGYPPVLFDILSPSREGAHEELVDILQQIYETPALTYADVFKQPSHSFQHYTPNILSPGTRELFLELTAQGTFRTYRVAANTDGVGRYELRGIVPVEFPSDADISLIESQADFFLSRIPQTLHKGIFGQPIDHFGWNASLPQDPDLVLPRQY